MLECKVRETSWMWWGGEVFKIWANFDTTNCAFMQFTLGNVIHAWLKHFKVPSVCLIKSCNVIKQHLVCCCHAALPPTCKELQLHRLYLVWNKNLWNLCWIQWPHKQISAQNQDKHIWCFLMLFQTPAILGAGTSRFCVFSSFQLIPFIIACSDCLWACRRKPRYRL